MKMACENAMNAGAKGVKIIIGGRLGGAEIARSEAQKLGSIPLQTLDANVDYGVATAVTTYGSIGIKVWIYKGKFGEEIIPISRPAERRRPQRSKSRKSRSDVSQSRVPASQEEAGGAETAEQDNSTENS